MDLMDIIIVFFIIMIVIAIVKGYKNAREANGASKPDGTQTVGMNTFVEGDKQQLVEDIKATQTGRILDQVAILQDLDATSPGYRHFCELTGTSQSSGGVTAPYSKRKVAYYDVRCYKIERVNGQEMETLVAQERSIEPFYFTDESCDTKVHVSLETFGKNVILVNSMNHIEGPKSDFSKAISNRTASLSGTGAATYMVGDEEAEASSRVRQYLSGSRMALGNASVRCASTFQRVLDSSRAMFGVHPMPALAAADVSSASFRMTSGASGASDGFYLADSDVRGKPHQGGLGSKPPSGGYASQPLSSMGLGSSKPPTGGSGKPPSGGSSKPPTGGSGKPPSGGYASKPPSSMGMGSEKPHKPTISVNVGSTGFPQGLDTFLGLGGSGLGGLQQNPYLGGPQNPYYSGYGTSGSNITGALLNIGLSALLASLNTSSSSPAPSSTATPSSTSSTNNPAYTQTNNTFMGYRIVEDVVPLNYPVYCLGEIYKNGQEIYMAKSIGKVSRSYYFATKLEAEVLAHLQA